MRKRHRQEDDYCLFAAAVGSASNAATKGSSTRGTSSFVVDPSSRPAVPFPFQRVTAQLGTVSVDGHEDPDIVDEAEHYLDFYRRYYDTYALRDAQRENVIDGLTKERDALRAEVLRLRQQPIPISSSEDSSEVQAESFAGAPPPPYLVLRLEMAEEEVCRTQRELAATREELRVIRASHKYLLELLRHEEDRAEACNRTINVLRNILERELTGASECKNRETP